jgi:hypothetical protein
MGSWGTGLYSSDFALDLRQLIGAVARLPFEPDRLLEILCETEPAAAGQADDPDHSVFWLTVADQFAKRGIDCRTARERALAMVDDGTDLALMARLGMAEKDLAKRRKMLAELRGTGSVPGPAPKAITCAWNCVRSAAYRSIPTGSRRPLRRARATGRPSTRPTTSRSPTG